MKMRMLFIPCLLFLFGSQSMIQPGNYGAITETELSRLKLEYYFVGQAESKTADFEWTFQKTRFVIQKKESAIPDALQRLLLPDGVIAEKIEGKWSWQNKPGELPALILQDIKADGKQIQKVTTLHPMKSAPTIIRMGTPQYVFTIQPEKK